jgi:hypothetical protein
LSDISKIPQIFKNCLFFAGERVWGIQPRLFNHYKTMPNIYGTHMRALIIKIQENTQKFPMYHLLVFLIIGNLSVRFDLPARRIVASQT